MEHTLAINEGLEMVITIRPATKAHAEPRYEAEGGETEEYPELIYWHHRVLTLLRTRQRRMPCNVTAEVTAEEVAACLHIGRRYARELLLDLIQTGLLRRAGTGSRVAPFRYSLCS